MVFLVVVVVVEAATVDLGGEMKKEKVKNL